MSLTDSPSPTSPKRNSGMTGETKFMIAALLVIALGGGSLFALNAMNGTPPGTTPEASPTPLPTVSAKDVDDLFATARHQKGDTNSAFTFVEFADFQCPSCRRAYSDTISKMEKTLPAFRLGFVNLPLPMHERAIPAALAAEAAAKQGKFWEMYALLFDKKYEDLTDSELSSAAKVAGLDMQRFTTDVQSKAALQALVDADMKVASNKKVDSTPTFFIHDKAGNTATLAGAANLGRLYPDLKDGVLGNDKIEPLSTPDGVPITLFIAGKREER